MTISRFTPRCALAPVFLTAIFGMECTSALGAQPGDPAATPAAATAAAASPSEPITLHAHIEYKSIFTTTKVPRHHEYQMSFELQEPAMRAGKGASAQYMYPYDNAGRNLLVGSARARGQANFESGDVGIEATYDKGANWPTPATPSSGLFTFLPPNPSTLGTGLSLQISLHVPVTGTGVAHLHSGGISMEVAPEEATPIECLATRRNAIPGEPQQCSFDIALEPTPDSNSKDLSEIREALASQEAAMAMLGRLFGASTEYGPDGHFIVRFDRSYEQTIEDNKTTLQINITAWSTGRNGGWRPEGVPPLKQL